MCEDLEKFKIEMPGARIIIYWTVDKWDRLWINFPGKYSRAEFTEEMEYNFCQFLLKRLNRRGYIMEKGQYTNWIRITLIIIPLNFGSCI